MVERINRRPRKCLGYRAPYDVFADALSGALAIWIRQTPMVLAWGLNGIPVGQGPTLPRIQSAGQESARAEWLLLFTVHQGNAVQTIHQGILGLRRPEFDHQAHVVGGIGIGQGVLIADHTLFV